MLNEINESIKRTSSARKKVPKAPTDKTKPLKSFRLGTVTVAVWPSDSSRNKPMSATVELYFRADDGTYQPTTQWGEAALILLAKLAEKAVDFMLNEKEKNIRK